VLVVAGSRVKPVDDTVPWVPTAQVPVEGTRVLLGQRDGRVWFAYVVDASYAEGDGWVGIRDLLQHLAGAGVEQAPLVFHAIGLASGCSPRASARAAAGRLEPRLAGHEQECVECHRRQFPRTDPAVIMAITPRRARLAGRGSAARSPGRLAVRSLLDPGRLPGARRDAGGRRTP
jgi:NAD+ diphosphatase